MFSAGQTAWEESEHLCSDELGTLGSCKWCTLVASVKWSRDVPMSKYTPAHMTDGTVSRKGVTGGVRASDAKSMWILLLCIRTKPHYTMTLKRGAQGTPSWVWQKKEVENEICLFWKDLWPFRPRRSLDVWVAWQNKKTWTVHLHKEVWILGDKRAKASHICKKTLIFSN